MPTTYEDCDDDVIATAEAIIQRQYPGLANVKLTVKYLFAVNADGQALMHKGWPAAAVIKINSLKDRCAGKCDCDLTIDKDWWDNHDGPACEALLDHEFCHLELRRKKKDPTAVMTDDIGRPMLKIRKHDFECVGFFEIGLRHGRAAAEVEGIANVQSKWIQMGLDFPGNDMVPNPKTAATKKSGTNGKASFNDQVAAALDEAGVDYERNAKV